MCVCLVFNDVNSLGQTFVILLYGFFFFKYTFILVAPHGVWGLSSPTRAQTHAPCSGRV